MSNTKKDQLHDLILSLSKAEKRNFKLYVKRLQSNQDVLFVRLFDVLDKMPEYDEAVLLKKLKDVDKRQLSNLKRHLYTQLLKSLRLIYMNRYQDIEIREQIDHARILYEKGLYLQAKRLLERTKLKAQQGQQHLLHLEIVEFIKYIEERHITRSRKVEGKMEALLLESDVLEGEISNMVRLSSLKIRIHGLYITMGHARDQKDHWMVSEYFNSELEKVDEKDLSVIERIFLHQSYMWYNYIVLDFEKCYEHAAKWVELFDAHPKLKDDDPVLYMRGLSYVLASLFSMKRYAQYEKALQQFEEFSKEYSRAFGTTQEIIHFMYLTTARINLHILEGKFKEGVRLIPQVEAQIQHYARHIDLHRIMVFDYKMAWLFFGAEDYDKTIEYTNLVINTKAGHLREDIQCYSRLLNLMAHYELGHVHLLPYMTDSVARFFNKMKDLNEVQKVILNFFRDNTSIRDSKTVALQKFKQELIRLSKKPYEKRTFQHLDMLAWVDSKITGKPMSEIIRLENEQASVSDASA